MKICSRIARNLCKLFQISVGAYRSRPNSTHLAHKGKRNIWVWKCWIFTETLESSGPVIHLKFHEIASFTTDAIIWLKKPANTMKLRLFHGLSHVFRRFVSCGARLSTPLNVELQKNQQATLKLLNENLLKFINFLKNAFIPSLVLTLSNTSGYVTLDTKNCDVQRGYVVLQQQLHGTTKQTVCWSQSIIDCKRKYGKTQQDCGPIVWAVLLSRPYLRVSLFTTCTDHGMLKWISNLAASNGCLARWCSQFFECEGDVGHLADVKHRAADALFRL